MTSRSGSVYILRDQAAVRPLDVQEWEGEVYLLIQVLALEGGELVCGLALQDARVTTGRLIADEGMISFLPQV